MNEEEKEGNEPDHIGVRSAFGPIVAYGRGAAFWSAVSAILPP